MRLDENILRADEAAVYTLRALFTEYGYERFKMSRFEEYELYSKNKEFLVSEGVITFTDASGQLMALKPDVTLSIIKNMKEGGVHKYYYNENVYRGEGGEYREIMQTGLECIGEVGEREILEAAELAAKSLDRIGGSFILNISHVGVVRALLSSAGVQSVSMQEALKAVNEKNAGALISLLGEEGFERAKLRIKNYPSAKDALLALREVELGDEFSSGVSLLEKIYARLEELGFGENIKADFSEVPPIGYYSGVVFKGYISGVSQRVLSGGEYDGLLKRMKKSGHGIGFAVYLDALENKNEEAIEDAERGIINIALPKGRLGERVYDMFERAGFDCPSIKEPNRKLIFENPECGVRFFWVKPSDVAIYVERGAADIGVCGRDILLEYEPDVYELLDLGIGRCRMAVAAKCDFSPDPAKTLRVATKFSNIAKKYYTSICRDIDIIHLNGSIEIAPILGLSDVIVDIVETGQTLIENNLSPMETIVDISARLIANKAAYGFKAKKIEQIKKGLLKQVTK